MNHKVTEQTQTQKRATLLQRIFPWRGDSRREVVRKIALLFFCCVFLGSGGYLLNKAVLEPRKVQQENDDIRQIYYSHSSSSNAGASSATETITQTEEPALSFEQIQQINSDIIGWITIPNRNIDYPVLQSPKNSPEYYLYRNYKKEYSGHGSIFLNSDCDVKTSRNLILYGHNMTDGSMFAPLTKYDLQAYQKAPVVQFNTVAQKSKWKIIAIIKTNTLEEHGEIFNFLRTEFQDDEDFLNYVYQLRIRSTINMPVDFVPSDRILTLSTCSYEFKDFRTVVVARQVREGEDETVDVSQAVTNSRAVFPDCWYEKRGGQKPQWPDTYQEAMEQGLIDWSGE